MALIKQEMEALQYVRNTGGGARKANFLEDHEPIGERLWKALDRHGLVRIVDGRIYTTEDGDAVLAGRK